MQLSGGGAVKYILVNGAWEVVAAIATYTAAVQPGWILAVIAASLIALCAIAVLLLPLRKSARKARRELKDKKQ